MPPVANNSPAGAVISMRRPACSATTPRTRPLASCSTPRRRMPARTSTWREERAVWTTASMIARPAWSPFTRATRAGGVGGLQAGGEGAGRVAVEGGSEVAHGGRAFLGQQMGHGAVHQARAGRDGVGGVQGRGVSSSDRAAAMPPWAQADEHWFRGAPVSSTLRGAAARAAESPASPAPTIRTPSWWMRSATQISSTSTWWWALTRS